MDGVGHPWIRKRPETLCNLGFWPFLDCFANVLGGNRSLEKRLQTEIYIENNSDKKQVTVKVTVNLSGLT